MNYCYKEDFPEIIKSAGLNGFPKLVEKPVENVETPEKETIQVTAVKDGKSFSGVLTASKTIE